MLYPRVKSQFVHITTGAVLGTLIGLLAGWATGSHGQLVPITVISAAAFGACQGILCGMALEFLRQRREPGLLESTWLGASFAFLMTGPIVEATWLPSNNWHILVATGGLVGIFACVWKITGKLNAWVERVLQRLFTGRVAKLPMLVRGAVWGGSTATSLAVLCVCIHILTQPFVTSVDPVLIYYNLVPGGTMIGVGVAGLRILNHKVLQQPDDLARGITVALLGGLILVIWLIVEAMAGNVNVNDLSIIGIGSMLVWGLAFFLTITGVMSLFSMSVSIIANALLPAYRPQPITSR